MRATGLKVTLANVLMRSNSADFAGVQELAAETGAHYTLDPTITPMLNGDTSVLGLRLNPDELRAVFHDERLVQNVGDFCAPPGPVDDEIREGIPCSAGHSACSVSPWGEVYPCVQFPLPCGDLRQQTFSDIWQNSAQLTEVRAIRGKDLTTCSSLPGPRLHGRQHARTVFRRLRKILRPHRHNHRRHARRPCPILALALSLTVSPNSTLIKIFADPPAASSAGLD